MTKDKTRSRTIFILEKVINRIVLEAASVFPIVGDSQDVLDWVEKLRLSIVEAVKRKDIPQQPKYRDLSIDEKVETVYQFTEAEVKKILGKRQRKETADALLTLETPEPPLPPPSPPEEE